LLSDGFNSNNYKDYLLMKGLERKKSRLFKADAYVFSALWGTEAYSHEVELLAENERISIFPLDNNQHSQPRRG
jgi:hypothetical protein